MAFRFKQRSAGAWIALLGMAVLTAGCATGSVATGDSDDGGLDDFEPIVLTWSDGSPQGGTTGLANQAFMDYVEEASGGKVTFEAFWFNTLVPLEEQLSAAQNGITDVAVISSVAFHPDDLKAGVWMQGLGASEKDGGTFGTIQTSLAAYETYMTDPALVAEWESNGLQPLGGFATGLWGNLCTKEISTPEQAVGSLTNAPGALWAAEAEHLGFTPQYMPSPDVYEAVQRGVIDCHINPIFAFRDLSLWDVAKHLTVPPYTSAIGTVVPVIRTELWDSFPAEVKQIFIDASVAQVTEFIAQSLDTYADTIQRGIDEHGMIVHDPRPLHEALLPFQQEQLAQLVETAPANVTDPQASIDAWNARMQRWAAILDEAGVARLGDQDFAEAIIAGPDQPWQTAAEQLKGIVEID